MLFIYRLIHLIRLKMSPLHNSPWFKYRFEQPLSIIRIQYILYIYHMVYIRSFGYLYPLYKSYWVYLFPHLQRIPK